jgi:molybdenum-dependent DNA-binding transcriptional regulator ModE
MRTYEGNFQTITRDLERLLHEIDRLNEKIDEQDRDHSKKLQSLERELRKADDNLRTELRETALKLTDEKVDRQVLGDLLIELGSQLKSAGSFTGASKETLESKEE